MRNSTAEKINKMGLVMAIIEVVLAFYQIYQAYQVSVALKPYGVGYFEYVGFSGVINIVVLFVSAYVTWLMMRTYAETLEYAFSNSSDVHMLNDRIDKMVKEMEEKRKIEEKKLEEAKTDEMNTEEMNTEEVKTDDTKAE